MKKSITIIMMIALISIICLSLVACNPQTKYEKVELTVENIHDYLSFHTYILQGNMNPIAHFETSKKKDIHFENVYFYVDKYSNDIPIDVNWDGYSHFCYAIASSIDKPQISVSKVKGFVLVPM